MCIDEPCADRLSEVGCASWIGPLRIALRGVESTANSANAGGLGERTTSFFKRLPIGDSWGQANDGTGSSVRPLAWAFLVQGFHGEAGRRVFWKWKEHGI
jgi:hypothetical protein